MQEEGSILLTRELARQGLMQTHTVPKDLKTGKRRGAVLKHQQIDRLGFEDVFQFTKPSPLGHEAWYFPRNDG